MRSQKGVSKGGHQLRLVGGKVHSRLCLSSVTKRTRKGKTMLDWGRKEKNREGKLAEHAKEAVWGGPLKKQGGGEGSQLDS